MTTLDLTTLRLEYGAHDTRDEGVCLMEAAAWWAGEPHSDRPPCVSPVLADYGRNLNDVLPDDKRQRLVAFVPRLPGTAGDGRDQARAYMALDWLIRVYTPAWLRLVPALVADADLLAQHAPVTDLESARRVGEIVRQAASHAAAAWATTKATAGDAAWAAAWATTKATARDAAWAAAWYAAGDAARDAAWYAAGDAARDAAWAAAWAAAWYAAGDAARDAAWAAARAVTAPTVNTLQDSAITLYDHMITGAGVEVSR